MEGVKRNCKTGGGYSKMANFDLGFVGEGKVEQKLIAKGIVILLAWC